MTNYLTPHSAPSPQLPARPPLARHDGWTADKQRNFCQILAECGSVEHAAMCVGMTRQTAYRFRNRASGRAFSMGWDAALLLARQKLIDEAFELAFEGSIDRVTRDGQVIIERRRRDARSVLAAVTRLSSPAILGNAPAQAIAQEFEDFLGRLADDPAEACAASADFLAERGEAESIDDSDLAEGRMVLERQADALRRDAEDHLQPVTDPHQP
jgi:hypothetical protein